MRRDEEPAPGPRAVVGDQPGERLRLAALDRDHDDARVAVEPEPSEPPAGVGRRDLAARQLVEEVALEPALRVGDRPGLRELDREQGERVARDDPVELARLLGLADREEGLDATLRAHRLHPDVVPSVDERDREGRPLGPRIAQLVPDGVDAQARGAPGGGERHPVQVEQQRPSLDHPGERRRDALDPLPFHHRAGEHVLGVDRALQGVVLLGDDPREDRLGDRDERHRVRDLEERQARRLGRRHERLRGLLVREAEAEPEAGDARAGETLHVGALLGRRGADPHARGQDHLAALEPRGRVLELARVDPADRLCRVALAGEQPQRHARIAHQVPDGDRHARDCTERTADSGGRAWPAASMDGRTVQKQNGAHGRAAALTSRRPRTETRRSPRRGVGPREEEIARWTSLRNASSSPRSPARSRGSGSRAGRPPSPRASARSTRS